MNDVTSGLLGRLDLLDDNAQDRAEALLAQIQEDGVETVRFLFSDQHGLLRGKAVVAGAVPAALRNGVTAPSSLLLKTPSHHTVFPVWTKDAGFGEGVLTGAGDLILVPDMSTYRRLPWSPHSAWVLCDVVQGNGNEIPFASRTVLRTALDRLHGRGLDMITGLEVEFHVFQVTDPKLAHADGGMPGAPPETSPLNLGYQLLLDHSYGAVENIVDELRRTAVAMGLPVRSTEVEFGPSQFEFTFDPAPAWEHADNMVMFRAMVKQVCAKRGLHATFMCRPVVANAMSSGWHVHQSVVDLETGANRFKADGDDLSPIAAKWIAGLLVHAAECCLLTTPTVNGYKRYQPYMLAPDRIQWGRGNRGAMLRALLAPGDAASRIENRVPEPAANPHYVFAAQILAGLSGIDRGLTPPPPVEMPYDSDATALPQNLGEAIEAFSAGLLFAETYGPEFTHYMTTLKRAEWQSYLSALSEWEHREYGGLF